MRARRIFSSLSILILISLSSSGWAAYAQPPKPEPIKQTLRFVKGGNLKVGGKERWAGSFTSISGSGGLIAYIGMEKNEPIAALVPTLDHLQQGDIVNVTLEKIDNLMNIMKCKKVEVKPGEENPHGFVYKESYNEEKTGNALVRITKYEENFEVILPYVKDEKGKPQPDPEMVDLVNKLKPDQTVYVQMGPPMGKQRLLLSIFPYKEPQTGKVVKVSDQTVDGGKTQGIDIETSDGKTVPVLVPGRMVSKKFVPDMNLTRAVHSYSKPGVNVSFLTREDNGKEYLVEIGPAPKTPPLAAGKPEKMDNKGTDKPASDPKATKKK